MRDVFYSEEKMISVIVPVYNLEKYIIRTLDSILAQTYTDIEVIVVNDGSTDATADVLESYVSTHLGKVKVIHKDNGGVTSARLAGVTLATGEWIGFVDGDDEIEPDMYEILLNNAVEYQADISHCGYQMVFPDGRVHYFHNTGCLVCQDKEKGVKDLLDGSLVEPGLCNKLFHKKLFYDLLSSKIVPIDIKINEDLLMNYYLFSFSCKSVFEDVCKYHYTVRRSSVSRQKLNKHKIYDPIRVKQIILEECSDEIREDAEKALVKTCVYTFASLVMDDKLLKKEKEDVRSLIKRHYHCISKLPPKTKFLAFLIVKFPIGFSFIYTLYAKWFQKKRYE